jgi:hypothetical protein
VDVEHPRNSVADFPDAAYGLVERMLARLEALSQLKPAAAVTHAEIYTCASPSSCNCIDVTRCLASACWYAWGMLWPQSATVLMVANTCSRFARLLMLSCCCVVPSFDGCRPVRRQVLTVGKHFPASYVCTLWHPFSHK